jgi:t-SNARE complex subunit (syntaxin)
MSDEGGVDRLKEMLGDTAQEETAAVEDQSTETQEHMKRYEPIKKGLALIKDNVEKINKLKQKDRTTANEKTRKEIMQELDLIMAQTTATGAQIKKTFEDIKKLDAKENKDSAKGQLRANMYTTNIRRFHQVMNDYNAAAHEFKQVLQERTRRQLKIVDSKMTDEQVEAIVESGQANDVIKQALLSDNLTHVVQEIEERHQDVIKLEKQVLEVFELFRDLATLVDLQQESLDVIEHRIQNAAAYTKAAEIELVQAEGYQKKARQRKCCLIMIVLAVLLAIIVPTAVTTLKSS